MSFTYSDVADGEVLDVRDIIERCEELREEREDDCSDRADWYSKQCANTGVTEPFRWEAARDAWARRNKDKADELAAIEAMLKQLCGYGGDHQWDGDWYPVTLVPDSGFTDYAEEFAKDVHPVDDQSWPFNCIDWGQAAEQLKQDYSSVDFPHDGETYSYHYR